MTNPKQVFRLFRNSFASDPMYQPFRSTETVSKQRNECFADSNKSQEKTETPLGDFCLFRSPLTNPPVHVPFVLGHIVRIVRYLTVIFLFSFLFEHRYAQRSRLSLEGMGLMVTPPLKVESESFCYKRPGWLTQGVQLDGEDN